MSKRAADEDWVPPKSAAQPKKKENKKKEVPAESGREERFLNQNKEFILRMDESGESASTIAAALCKKAGLRDTAVTSKDISNWKQYHKNAGKIKTRKVNSKNNNIKASDDDCMLAI